MSEWLTLTDALSRTMRAHAPGWTDRPDADPGITMLEMLAFLADGLRFQRGAVAGGSPTAARIVDALSAYDEPVSIAVRVNGRLWRRVDAFAEAGSDEPVYIFDQATGTLAFGDGVNGRRPEPGDTITAGYRDGAPGSASILVTATWPLRLRFFSGRLLTVADLTEEQSYHRDKPAGPAAT